MLYGLFSLQTNLCISLHYQSDILQHTGSNYEQLLLCKAVQSNWLISMCLGVIILHMIVCTMIHNCLSSGSHFFASLRWNN